MVVADGLAPIWRQGICNHRYAVSRSVCIKSDQRIEQPKRSPFSVEAAPRSSTRNIQLILVLANHARRYVSRGIDLTHRPLYKMAAIS